MHSSILKTYVIVLAGVLPSGKVFSVITDWSEVTVQLRGSGIM